MDALVRNFFNLEIIQAAGPYLLRGLGMTALLCLVVVPSGLAGGLGVALLSTVRSAWVRWPLVVYFGLPFLGLDLPAFAAVAVAFLLNTSSYYGEIFRAGIESVGAGQTEAARSTGLTRLQTLTYVVVPQATRNVLPDLIGNTLEVVKLTSLASVVALPELLYAARSAQSVTFNASPLVAAAILYFVLLWPAVRLLSRLEHRLLVSHV